MKSTTKTRRAGMIGLALSATLVAASMMPAAATDTGVSRLSGEDRYETAVAVSHENFLPDSPVVYIASGGGFADALAGAPAAGIDRAPVLLVPSGGIPASVAQELTRLRPADIVVLGGPGAVSDNVVSQLGAYTVGTVSRMSGPDRYATSAEVSERSFRPGVTTAYVASGVEYADALAGAPLAAANRAPVLLVQPGRITDEVAAELERLDPQSITVLGGASAVRSSVLADLAEYTDGTVTRIAGDDRYLTAAAIAGQFGTDITSAYVASGQSYADALAAAPVAGAQGVPVFLARQGSVTLPDLPALEKVTLVGGTAALSDRVRTQVQAHLTNGETPTPEPTQPEPTPPAPAPEPGAPTPTPAPTTPAPKPTSPAPPVTYNPPAGYDGQMFRLINAEREAAGVAPLQYWDPLRDGALTHSRWMLETGKQEHASARQQETDVYAAGCGVRWGENIYWSWGLDVNDASAAVDWYMNSPAHRANILNPAFKYVATGTVDDGYNLRNTQRFAGNCN